MFNGRIVSEIVGLTGVELGEFMKNLKGKMPEREELIKLSQDEINDLIKKQYEVFKSDETKV